MSLETTNFDTSSIRNPRAIGLIAYLQSGVDPYVKLVGVEVTNVDVGLETVFFDVKVDRPNHVVADIRYEEPVAVQFFAQDSDHPEVLALRDDFPILPHTNLRSTPKPVSLCLYDRSFDEIRMTWTPEAFVQRIQEWFAKSAVGTLHDKNQPLEPFLPLSLPKLVLPEDFYSTLGQEQPSFYEIIGVGEESPVTFLIEKTKSQGREFPNVVGCHFVTNEVTHGIINQIPDNLNALNELLKSTGLNLVEKIREQLLSWNKLGFFNTGLLKSRLSIMLTIPHRRTQSSEAEQVHPWVFITDDLIGEIGKKVGLWDFNPSNAKEIGLFIKPDEAKNGAEIKIYPMVPIAPFSVEMAAKMNGLKEVNEISGVIVGQGALGGYVSVSLALSGFGKWTYIDSDVLFPHNFARHVAHGRLIVGRSKARVVSVIANDVANDDSYSKFLIRNVLSQNDKNSIEAELEKSELIIDCTASEAATRSLTLDFPKATKRRVAFFLTPNGQNLVMMAESVDRKILLDSIEMQYLRALCEQPKLGGHLDFDSSKNRYARTCGDVSSTIPNELVSIFASIASAQVKTLEQTTQSSLCIWNCNPVTMEIQKFAIDLNPSLEMTSGDWTVVVDDGLVKKMKAMRASKLPNETGGSLVGTFDLSRKRIYVVDTLPTPSDSVESRTEFIRGEVGNSSQLEKVQKLTANQLFYLGEWHSHPRGVEVTPSGADQVLFEILESKMHFAGIPAVMLIVGDDDCSLQFSLPRYLPESKSDDISEHLESFLVLND